jgi:hypothetical protein
MSHSGGEAAVALPRTLACTWCKDKIDVDLDVSWAYSRSAVVMHILQCPCRPDSASGDEMNVLVDEIMTNAGQGRGRGPAT